MSRRKNKHEALRAAKERRKKQIAIGGGILLAILLAVQAPKLMHRGGSSTSAASPATTTAATSTGAPPDATTPGAVPAAAGTPTPVATPTVQTKLPNSDVVPVRQRSQLATFELFDSKDPFVQQISEEAKQTVQSSGTGSATTAPTAPTAPSTSGSAPPPPTVSSTLSAVQPPVTGRALAHTSSVVIAVNGKAEHVRVDQTFPSSAPTFKLVSIAGGVAMVGIANGGYASGAQTVALQLGRTLTLVDTTDSVRYELRLVSAS